MSAQVLLQASPERWSPRDLLVRARAMSDRRTSSVQAAIAWYLIDRRSDHLLVPRSRGKFLAPYAMPVPSTDLRERSSVATNPKSNAWNRIDHIAFSISSRAVTVRVWSNSLLSNLNGLNRAI